MDPIVPGGWEFTGQRVYETVLWGWVKPKSKSQKSPTISCFKHNMFMFRDKRSLKLEKSREIDNSENLYYWLILISLNTVILRSRSVFQYDVHELY